MGLDVIVHPELGIIRGRGKPGYRTWETDPIQIGALGYRAPISLFTTNAEPMQQELALMLSAMQATNGFKARLAGHLLQQYTEYERPAYRKQVGNPEYTSVLTESDLPEIQHPTDIWRLITGLRGVYVEYVN